MFGIWDFKIRNAQFIGEKNLVFGIKKDKMIITNLPLNSW
jgi:hypothetical protein